MKAPTCSVQTGLYGGEKGKHAPPLASPLGEEGRVSGEGVYVGKNLNDAPSLLYARLTLHTPWQG